MRFGQALQIGSESVVRPAARCNLSEIVRQARSVRPDRDRDLSTFAEGGPDQPGSSRPTTGLPASEYGHDGLNLCGAAKPDRIITAEPMPLSGSSHVIRAQGADKLG
jgi:hypothetical protein